MGAPPFYKRKVITMSFLRLLKPVKPRHYESKGFQIDVLGLIASGLQRYICFMDKSEVRRHIYKPSQDITGLVVIIGGIGVVDGFSKIQSPSRGRIAVTIFELRNAQYYISTPLDGVDKDKHGRFCSDSFYGQMMSFPDLSPFDGKDHS